MLILNRATRYDWGRGVSLINAYPMARRISLHIPSVITITEPEKSRIAFRIQSRALRTMRSDFQRSKRE